MKIKITNEIEKLLKTESDRLKCCSYFTLSKNIIWWCEQTGLMESDGRNDNPNSMSSAKGYYQFTDGAFETAKNRLSRYFDKNFMKELNMYEEIQLLTLEQQTLLLLANIFQQKGTDDYLIDISKNKDLKSSKGLYCYYHHTNPDEATLKRLENYYV